MAFIFILKDNKSTVNKSTKLILNSAKNVANKSIYKI